LNGTVIPVEKDARAVRSLGQSQTTSIAGEFCELLDKVEFRQTFERRQSSNLHILQAHFSWPPTARCATLALVENRHPTSVASCG
jgi:hypothetical protein